MFTGIVVATGQVKEIQKQGTGVRLTLEAAPLARQIKVGDSVALNGCCLTVVSVRKPCFAFQAVPETLKRTSLGTLKVGNQVNLELPLGAKDRFGGHVVQGHVDGQARWVSAKRTGLGWVLKVRIPRSLTRYVVEKGSIALDGISLTVAAIRGDEVEVALIPHTWEVTNLSQKGPGDRLNVEVDMLAKHVEKLVGPFLKAMRNKR